eukprot:7697631-Pyramimonas_sp.AAC.1
MCIRDSSSGLCMGMPHASPHQQSSRRNRARPEQLSEVIPCPEHSVILYCVEKWILPWMLACAY